MLAAVAGFARPSRQNISADSWFNGIAPFDTETALTPGTAAILSVNCRMVARIAFASAPASEGGKPTLNERTLCESNPGLTL
jgi:hypothetical protein